MRPNLTKTHHRPDAMAAMEALRTERGYLPRRPAATATTTVDTALHEKEDVLRASARHWLTTPRLGPLFLRHDGMALVQLQDQAAQIGDAVLFAGETVVFAMGTIASLQKPDEHFNDGTVPLIAHVALMTTASMTSVPADLLEDYLVELRCGQAAAPASPLDAGQLPLPATLIRNQQLGHLLAEEVIYAALMPV